MKIIRKFSPNEKDLKESIVQTELMRDFPPISKEDNPEVLAELIAAYARNQVESFWIKIPLTSLMRLLSESEEKGPRLMIIQKLLVLRPRNKSWISLKQPTMTACLLLLPRGKEVKENPLQSKKQLN